MKKLERMNLRHDCLEGAISDLDMKEEKLVNDLTKSNLDDFYKDLTVKVSRKVSLKPFNLSVNRNSNDNSQNTNVDSNKANSSIDDSILAENSNDDDILRHHIDSMANFELNRSKESIAKLSVKSTSLRELSHNISSLYSDFQSIHSHLRHYIDNKTNSFMSSKKHGNNGDIVANYLALLNKLESGNKLYISFYEQMITEVTRVFQSKIAALDNEIMLNKDIHNSMQVESIVKDEQIHTLATKCDQLQVICDSLTTARNNDSVKISDLEYKIAKLNLQDEINRKAVAELSKSLKESKIEIASLHTLKTAYIANRRRDQHQQLVKGQNFSNLETHDSNGLVTVSANDNGHSGGDDSLSRAVCEDSFSNVQAVFKYPKKLPQLKLPLMIMVFLTSRMVGFCPFLILHLQDHCGAMVKGLQVVPVVRDRVSI